MGFDQHPMSLLVIGYGYWMPLANLRFGGPEVVRMPHCLVP